MLDGPQKIVDRLREFQRAVRGVVMKSHRAGAINEVARISHADTIYKIDTDVDPILVAFCEEWAKTTPLVLIAEGLEDAAGKEVEHLVFPQGTRESDAKIRLIVDPIDGTRQIMYDKRSAWALAGVAPNKGAGTRLSDIEVSVMTELPTSKLGWGDVLWATRGAGAEGVREPLFSGCGTSVPLRLSPSSSDRIDHGYAMICNFFPGTKVLSSELIEFLVRNLIGPADVTRATVFDDQYISTGGQFYELLVVHDRFNADLRPAFYRMQYQPEGLCCHPYDCAALLIAQEAGVIITDTKGAALDGPLDTTTGISWVGYANERLRKRIEPLLLEFLSRRKVHS